MESALSLSLVSPTMCLLELHSPQLTTQQILSLRPLVMQALEKKKPRYILVQLSQVQYMDSFGLAFLLSLFKYAQSQQGKLLLVSPQSSVTQLIHLTKITHIMEVYPTVAAAMASLEEG